MLDARRHFPFMHWPSATKYSFTPLKKKQTICSTINNIDKNLNDPCIWRIGIVIDTPVVLHFSVSNSTEIMGKFSLLLGRIIGDMGNPMSAIPPYHRKIRCDINQWTIEHHIAVARVLSLLFGITLYICHTAFRATHIRLSEKPTSRTILRLKNYYYRVQNYMALMRRWKD